VHVKVCGITTPEDAVACVELGVDWLGLNFVPSSPRCIDVARAQAIRAAVDAVDAGRRGHVELVGVVADLPLAALRELRTDAGLDRLQLHGGEPPALVQALAPVAFKAVRVGSAADVEEAEGYEGLLLIDAKVAGALGGTGRTVDFSLVAPLARRREVLLAGGLGPASVEAAVRAVRPWGVDVASGVERAPGVKDLGAVKAFVAAARLAAAG
jgi:phosphoribosylanthranilate isomerase